MVSSSSSSRPPPPGFYSSHGQPPPPPPPISQFGHHGYHPTQQQPPPQMYHMTSSTTTPPPYGMIPPPPPPQPGYGHASMYSSFPSHQQQPPASQHHASVYNLGYSQQHQQQYQSPYSYSYSASGAVPGAAPGASPQAPRSYAPEAKCNSKMNDQKSIRKRPRQKNHRQQKQQENTKTEPNTNNDVRNESDDGSSSVASTNEQQTKKKFKKDAVSKTDDKQTWTCTTCNVTVDSERAWKDHRRNHVKCTECDFEGCPKVVKGHFQAHHGKFSGSGFKTVTINIPGCKVQRFKICVGNNPEDIQKWIAERKKRFPRFSSKTNNNVSPTTSTESREVITSEEKTIDGKETKDHQQVGEKTSQTQTGSASGLASLLAGYGSSSSEDEVEEEKESIANNPSTKLKMEDEGNVNNTKIPNDDDTEKPPLKETDSTATTPPTAPTTGTKRPCRFFFGRRGSCRHGDACKFSHEVSELRQGQDVPGQQQRKKQKLEQQQKQKNKQQQRGRPTTSDTLLRKLLMPDMDRESRLSFQLLKYIHDSNFFFEDDDDDGCGSNTKTE